MVTDVVHLAVARSGVGAVHTWALMLVRGLKMRNVDVEVACLGLSPTPWSCWVELEGTRNAGVDN